MILSLLLNNCHQPLTQRNIFLVKWPRTAIEQTFLLKMDKEKIQRTKPPAIAFINVQESMKSPLSFMQYAFI